MPIRVTNLRLAIDEPEAALPRHLARALGVPDDALGEWRILRKSLDTRDKADVHFVFSAAVRLPDDEARLVRRAAGRSGAKVELFADEPFRMPPPGAEPLDDRPVVIGSGPGGLVAAYFLALHGYRPLMLERGTRVSQRIRDVKAFDA